MRALAFWCDAKEDPERIRPGPAVKGRIWTEVEGLYHSLAAHLKAPMRFPAAGETPNGRRQEKIVMRSAPSLMPLPQHIALNVEFENRRVSSQAVRRRYGETRNSNFKSNRRPRRFKDQL